MTKFYPNSFVAGETIFEGKPIMMRFKELTLTEKILAACGFTCALTATCCLCAKCGCCTAISYGAKVCHESILGTAE